MITRSRLAVLTILLLAMGFVSAQSLSKTDILKQMKQFGFSDAVTAQAVSNDVSLKNILTLRKLQEIGFSDDVYIAVIGKKGDYTANQIAELAELKQSGFSDQLIIAALPDPSPSPASVVLKPSEPQASFSSLKKNPQPAASSSLLFPESSHNFAVTIIGAMEAEGLSEDMESGGGGFRWNAITQKSEKKGFSASINIFGYSMNNLDQDDNGFESQTVVMQNYFSWLQYFQNGIKKDIAGEIQSRGTTLAAGPVLGWGLTSIDSRNNQYDKTPSFTSSSTFNMTGELFSGIAGVRAYAEVPIIPGVLYGTAVGDLNASFIFGTIETRQSGYYYGTGISFTSLPTTESSEDVEESYFTPGYNFDIVLYPSQSFPQLKLTLGTMLQILNDDDSLTMYTFGMTWSFGPLYKSRSIGVNVTP